MALTAEQLAFRRTCVTATDTVTLAGEGYRGKSVLDVYLEKISDEPPVEQPPNTAMRVGNTLEPLALQLLAEERGLNMWPPHPAPPDVKHPTERHPELVFLGATPDSSVLAEAVPSNDFAVVRPKRVAIAEAKVVGLYQATRWGVTPPDRVVIQVTKQMIVTGTKLAHVVALIGTEPRYYVVEYEPTLAEALVELDRGFWLNHVVPRRPPAPEATEAAGRALRQLYPRVRGDVFRASPEVEEVARRYFMARAAFDTAEEALLGAENAIKAIIGDRKGVEGDGWIATWQERKGSVSWKGVAEELQPHFPEFDAIAARHRGAGTRAFVCKATTGNREDG